MFIHSDARSYVMFYEACNEVFFSCITPRASHIEVGGD